MKQKLITGSRGSELALLQAKFIKWELEKAHKNISIEIKLIKNNLKSIL
ncbi:MAG: hypothetical protein M0P61_15070 [Ignavibacteriaceae bacterium]|jgi:hydroxymethylbilane synthase|nr:hypothetical protein [Ignavibacteriaceae bacterium]